MIVGIGMYVYERLSFSLRSHTSALVNVLWRQRFQVTSFLGFHDVPCQIGSFVNELSTRRATELGVRSCGPVPLWVGDRIVQTNNAT